MPTGTRFWVGSLARARVLVAAEMARQLLRARACEKQLLVADAVRSSRSNQPAAVNQFCCTNTADLARKPARQQPSPNSVLVDMSIRAIAMTAWTEAELRQSWRKHLHHSQQDIADGLVCRRWSATDIGL
jgi:hypothetical protein